MSGRSEVLAVAAAVPWAILRDDEYILMLYRWDFTTRIELHVLFDKQNRVVAWSEWHNNRVGSPHHEAGRRAHLLTRMEKI